MVYVGDSKQQAKAIVIFVSFVAIRPGVLRGYRFNCRKTFGGMSQTSEAARLEVRLPTSMRQMPPFLKGSARPAPIR
jgi:hypothetical protein